MVELVDTRDLKSLGRFGRAGSSPAPGTTKILFKSINFKVFLNRIILLYLYGGIAKWLRQEPAKL